MNSKYFLKVQGIAKPLNYFIQNPQSSTMASNMIKAKKLQAGDKIATISLSWGGAGDIPNRYEVGKKQLIENFGIEVVETKNALKSDKWLQANPEARAEDLMEAFLNPEIKAIFSNIGGEDSIRTLPFMDYEVIRNNPKIFLGFSDTTVSHFCCYKAGLSSFYGTSILCGFAENGGMFNYDINDLNATLFSSKPRGMIKANKEGWTSERLAWEEPQNQIIKRKLVPCEDWRFLQGEGIQQGQLLGGCLEVMDWLKGTDVWIDKKGWENKIIFLETSEQKMSPGHFRQTMRSLTANGIFEQAKGIILGRPYDNQYWEEYDQILLQILREEQGLDKLAIVTGMDFGHTSPVFTIPYGINAEIDLSNKTFSLLESAVID